MKCFAVSEEGSSERSAEETLEEEVWEECQFLREVLDPIKGITHAMQCT